MSATPYPCPCCGHQVFAEPPGSDDICMICFWEDDATQLRFPQSADVTNVVSLAEAQQNYAKFGAIEERFAGDVRKPEVSDVLDPGFRPLSGDDPFETDATEDAGGPSDPAALYYWRPTYWRSVANKPA